MPKPKRPEDCLPRGRPTSFRPEYSERARDLCLLGMIDEQLAKHFDVPVSTLNNWKNAHPNFMEAIVQGREGADAEIGKALFHRARGYSHDEDDIRTVALGANSGSGIVVTKTTKHYPPDTAAASLWLRNRQPKLWRDKVDIEHSGPGGGPIQTANLTPTEFAEVAKKIAQEI